MNHAQMGPGSGAEHPTDPMFTAQMIPHHQAAIDMAALAATRAEHPEIKQLAADIASGQASEIALMKRVGKANKWDPNAKMQHSGSEGMSTSEMGMDMDVSKLKSAKPFDKAFIEMMVPHHEGGDPHGQPRACPRFKLRNSGAGQTDNQIAVSSDEADANVVPDLVPPPAALIDRLRKGAVGRGTAALFGSFLLGFSPLVRRSTDLRKCLQLRRSAARLRPSCQPSAVRSITSATARPGGPVTAQAASFFWTGKREGMNQRYRAAPWPNL